MDAKDSFIEGVWEKVRMLEYKKIEEELVKEGQRNLRREKIKVGSILFLVALLILIPVYFLVKDTLFSTIISGVVLLSLGKVYEYIQDSNVERRVFYEN